MSNYTNQSLIEAKLGSALSASQVAYLAALLPAIDAYINSQTGVSFGSSEDTVFYVTGTGTSTLIIPTIDAITSVYRVETDGTETLVDSSEYRPYPRTSPIYAIKNINADWEEDIDYKITASEVAVPQQLALVATELAINFLNDSSNNYKSEKVGDWSVTYSDVAKSMSGDAERILGTYQRLSRSI